MLLMISIATCRCQAKERERAGAGRGATEAACYGLVAVLSARLATWGRQLLMTQQQQAGVERIKRTLQRTTNTLQVWNGL